MANIAPRIVPLLVSNQLPTNTEAVMFVEMPNASPSAAEIR